MKKILSILVSMFLLFQFSLLSFAALSCDVGGKDVTVAAGESVEIPINISSNPGIMGCRISVKYDSEKVDVKSVSRGKVLAKGNFNTNFGIHDGTFDILWNNTEETGENGTLFTIVMTVKEALKDKSVVSLSFSQPDTFNEQYEDVAFNCRNIIVTKSNETDRGSGEIELPDVYPTEITTEEQSMVETSVPEQTDNDNGGNSNIVDAIKDTLNDMNINSVADVPEDRHEVFVAAVKDKVKNDGDMPNVLDDLNTYEAFKVIKDIEEKAETEQSNRKIIIVAVVAVSAVAISILVIIIVNKKRKY